MKIHKWNDLKAKMDPKRKAKLDKQIKKENAKIEKQRPKVALDQVKIMIDAGISIAFDQYMGEYQATVYHTGKQDHLNHSHYEAKSLEEAIDKAFKATIVK